MKFSILYEHVAKCWPERIDVSDCYKNPAGDLVCPTLRTVWDAIEAADQGEFDEWFGLMCWCIYCDLGRLAKVSYESGRGYILLKDINIYNVERKCRNDLSEPEWIDYVKAYVNDLEEAL
ncbi:hypothetical protein [Desulfovibrio psychrotolerans]|uniref:Uncharacterized protein n=1 Tax=Desulfovibrio psychrotolerans TaxID=415242 RepID=A0A7J0BXZ1_9BACT|nr:hypothetical protein [Desulfovibrio psychrotolerans]GFM38041.1 hypothetical protein DSM19430T_27250 [Desulfovibrio psychrotolerans]